MKRIDFLKPCKGMNFKSKLRVTKPLTKIISLVCIVMLCVVFQGCEKEELVISQDYGLCNVKQVAMSELPEGVTPLIINSKEEFENTIYQLNNLEVKTTKSTYDEVILSEENGKLVFNVSITKLEEPDKIRLKSGNEGPDILDVGAENVGGLDVLIHLAYTEIGGSIVVTSTESSSSFWLSWFQTSGNAAFINSNSNIEYHVRGDVVAYIFFESLYEVSRDNYSIDGNINLNL